MIKYIVLTVGLLIVALRLLARSVSSSASSLVKFYESSNKPTLKARYDSLGKIWEIGYGCTTYENGVKVKEGDTITLQRAEQLHQWHMNNARQRVLNVVKVKLTENQLQALTSLVYNIGIGNFGKSTMLKLINQKKFKEAAAEFEKWDNAGGKMNVAGLVKRRLDEKKLFLT